MFSEDIVTQLSNGLKHLLENCDAAQAALVATVDGHMVAMEQRGNYLLERLATMGCSIMSLGDTITSELQMGTCNNIISENELGIVTFMHINDDVVLISLTTQKNALGMLLTHSKKCAKNLKTILNK
jgi:predicted regulator of Ras-like GTPase activity (Roadblock/LC7/MglB family)